MQIVLVSGSAREERRSHIIALALKDELQAQGAEVRILDVKEAALPPLDYRYSKHPNPSETLKKIAGDLEWAQAFVLVSPEYNGSFSGPLKNTLDYFYPEYNDKPFGLVSVSAGGKGGINALRALQHYVLVLQGILSPKGLPTGNVNSLINDEGQLSDEDYQERLQKFAKHFLAFAKKHK